MLDAGLWSGSEQIGAGQGQPGSLCSWFQLFNSSIFQISLMASRKKKPLTSQPNAHFTH